MMQKTLIASFMIWSLTSVQAQDRMEHSEPSAALQSESAHAVEEQAPEPEAAKYIGHATRALLAMQASGAHASSQNYVTPGVVAHKVYERYVNSFGHPIPERLASNIGESSQ